jgi:transcriptional regulator with XRE-family HTH domain
MTAAQQIGLQLKAARENANMSARALGHTVGVSAPTIGEYESGNSVPKADVLAKIAEALDLRVIEVDGYRLTITRVERIVSASSTEQLALDFAGQYAFSKATVRLSPGRISIAFDGVTPVPLVQVS